MNVDITSDIKIRYFTHMVYIYTCFITIMICFDLDIVLFHPAFDKFYEYLFFFPFNLIFFIFFNNRLKTILKDYIVTVNVLRAKLLYSLYFCLYLRNIAFCVKLIVKKCVMMQTFLLYFRLSVFLYVNLFV